MNLETTVKAFISKHRLLSHEGHYLVGVSGGADSVCLLLMMVRLGYKVTAVHCNFNLRGEESQRDENFVKKLCEELHIKLSITHFDTRIYADLHKVSIEMAARQLRYHYFEQLRRDIGATAICVAHHRDDSVETVLFNLIRGTGIEGLTGIKPVNSHVVRPLLCVSRKDIEQWLKEQGQDYVTDSSNLVADVQRNQLRLNVIPMLEKVMPGAVGGIAQTAQWLTEANNVYRNAMNEALGRLVNDNAITLDQLMHEPSPESILYEWLHPMGFTSAAITDIFHSPLEQGSHWTSATHELVVHQGQLIAYPIEDERPTLRIPETGNYIYDETAKFSISVTDGKHIIYDPQAACLDSARLSFPLTIRPVCKGDRFHPFGMKGSRLVSDYLTDCHLSIVEKRRQLVVTDSEGHIVWLVGHRPDDRFCIGPNTQQTLIIKLTSVTPETPAPELL